MVERGDTVKVKVRLADKLADKSADTSLDAVGVRSNDGEEFHVRVTIGETFQDIGLTYADVVAKSYDRDK